MPEYIERSAAIAIIKNTHYEYPTWPHIVEAKERAVREIKAIPAADVETVRRGKWVYPLGLAWNYVCSECGANGGVIGTPYCPNCGARMNAPEKETGI